MIDFIEINNRIEVSGKKEELFVETILNKLNPHLNDESKRQIDSVRSGTLRLLKELELDTGAFDSDQVENIERAILAMGMVYKEQNSSDVENKDKVKRQLALIYSHGIGNSEYSIFEPDTGAGFPYEVFVGLMEHFWKEEFLESGKDGFIEWIVENKVEDEVLTLPINALKDYKGYRKVFETVWEKYKTPEDKRHVVTALALKAFGFILVQEDADEKIVNHEKSHLEKPGLRVKSLGSALNEIMTEFDAGMKTNKKYGLGWQEQTKDGLEKIMHNTGLYVDIGRMFVQIIRYDTKLLDMFKNRYSDKTETNALKLGSRLINDFGLGMYLDIYMAHSDIQSVDEQNKKAGLLWPETITRKLFYINSQAHKPNDW
jgi:hypothetical protein